MKCCNPNCNHGIGLVAYRRGWFGKRLYCFKDCRDPFVVDSPKISQQKPSVAPYFAWLLRQPDVHLRPQMIQPGSVSGRAKDSWGAAALTIDGVDGSELLMLRGVLSTSYPQQPCPLPMRCVEIAKPEFLPHRFCLDVDSKRAGGRRTAAGPCSPLSKLFGITAKARRD
jgi:hypothetical protein